MENNDFILEHFGINICVDPICVVEITIVNKREVVAYDRHWKDGNLPQQERMIIPWVCFYGAY